MAEAAAGCESTQTHFSDLSCGSPGAGTVADEAPSFRAHEATDAGVLSADTSIRSTAELGLQSITDVDVENGSAYAPAGSGLGHAFSDRSYAAIPQLEARWKGYESPFVENPDRTWENAVGMLKASVEDGFHLRRRDQNRIGSQLLHVQDNIRRLTCLSAFYIRGGREQRNI